MLGISGNGDASSSYRRIVYYGNLVGIYNLIFAVLYTRAFNTYRYLLDGSCMLRGVSEMPNLFLWRETSQPAGG